MAQARRKSSSTFSFNILSYLRRGVRETLFLCFVGVALAMLMALFSFNPQDPAWTHTSAGHEVTNVLGVTGAWFADIGFYFLGYLVYLLPVVLVFSGWRLFKRSAFWELDAEIVIFRSVGFVVVLAAGCGLASLHVDPLSSVGSAGGVVGEMAAKGVVGGFGFAVGALFLLVLTLAGATLATGVSWLQLLDAIGKFTFGLVAGLGRIPGKLTGWLRADSSPEAIDEPELASDDPSIENPDVIAEKKKPIERPKIRIGKTRKTSPDTNSTRPERIEPVLQVLPEEFASQEPSPLEPEPESMEQEALVEENSEPVPVVGPPRIIATPAPVRSAPKVAKIKPVGGTALPSLDLLDGVPTSRAGYSREVLEAMSRRLETLLQHFGVEVKVVAVEPGPVITRFELDPAPGVKVNQITNLSKDLARGLSVMSVRVVEVIPGKSVVGLEIPNQHRDIVYLSEILNAPVYAKSDAPMTLALGKDIGGNPVVANLAKMPHLLVAGTTGSGKSVAVNAMLLSILYKARPNQVRLILVDPKMLELSVYDGIPHLLAPVVTDMKEAAYALRWCVAEMERRYKLMAAMKVRNIAGFNRKVEEAIAAGEAIPDPLYRPEEHLDESGEIPGLEPLPFIVVVIDELADMMMIVGKKVEELIARLAQKARASGIHLILATQRPSVDVITGLIKANIPTRIAFQVSSKVDSRTILDQMGAEQLLGHGDMLYLPPGTGFPQRLHGAFVDDHEVNQVVEYLKQVGEPEYIAGVLEEPTEPTPGIASEIGTNGGGDEADPLYDQAVRIVTETRKASISGVQRRLKIGYNRAARMIEEMENAGIVGSLESNGTREVLAPPPPEV